MEHKDFRDNLSAYLDGELPAGEKAALEGHLASCADCARELEELRSVSALVKKHAMEPVPHALKDAVLSGRPARPFYAAWLRPAGVLAAAAAALLVMLALPGREKRAVYSPDLFSASVQESGFGSRGAPDPGEATAAGEPSSAAKEEKTFGGEGAGAPAGGAAPQGAAPASGAMAARARYAVPGFARGGSFSQAKFAAAAKGKAPAARSYEAAAAADSAPDAAAKPEAGLSRKAAPGPERLLAITAVRAGPEPGSFTPGKKPVFSAPVPAWAARKAAALAAGYPGNPGHELWRYEYNGAFVYFFPGQCCDQYSELYDEKGKLLCAPDGGMTGDGDGKCRDFHEKAVKPLLLWRDSRAR